MPNIIRTTPSARPPREISPEIANRRTKSYARLTAPYLLVVLYTRRSINTRCLHRPTDFTRPLTGHCRGHAVVVPDTRLLVGRVTLHARIVFSAADYVCPDVYYSNGELLRVTVAPYARTVNRRDTRGGDYGGNIISFAGDDLSTQYRA